MAMSDAKMWIWLSFDTTAPDYSFRGAKHEVISIENDHKMAKSFLYTKETHVLSDLFIGSMLLFIQFDTEKSIQYIQ